MGDSWESCFFSTVVPQPPSPPALCLWLGLPDALNPGSPPQGPSTFRIKMEGVEDSPEVIWTAEMKARLVERVSTDLQPYVKARAHDPLALYIYHPNPPLTYPEVDGEAPVEGLGHLGSYMGYGEHMSTCIPYGMWDVCNIIPCGIEIHIYAYMYMYIYICMYK